MHPRLLQKWERKGENPKVYATSNTIKATLQNIPCQKEQYYEKQT